MYDSVRNRLRGRLASGFWFPLFVRLLRWFRENASIVRYVERWLAVGEKEALGAPEAYQIINIAILSLWIVFLRRPSPTYLSSVPARIFGVVLTLYWATELFLFALHWAFAAEGPIASSQRSLATFFVNLPQLALLMFVAVALTGCDTSTATWHTVYQHLRAVFSLQLVQTQPSCGCRILAHYELFIAGTLLLVVVANLIGAIDRRPKTDAS